MSEFDPDGFAALMTEARALNCLAWLANSTKPPRSAGCEPASS